MFFFERKIASTEYYLNPVTGFSIIPGNNKKTNLIVQGEVEGVTCFQENSMQNRIKILSGYGNLAKVRVKEVMSCFPGIDFELVELKTPTTGNSDIHLNGNDINDLSARRIHHALLNNKGDIAIHPAKDLPFPIASGLTVFALAKSFDKADPSADRIETSSFEANPLQDYLAIVGRINDIYRYEIFKGIDVRENFGKVTIIGFGPGDPEYLTIKGKKALKKADIIFYDALIDKNYLSGFSCEKVFVGKRKGNHSKQQQEINRLLYHAAMSGKRTARLKGGDPSIFGRLGEEVQYLQERLIDVEIIPGVTSASAASAVIGIPLTRRGISKSVAFCSGHNVHDIQIPDAGVLVFFMAASNLVLICHKLIEKGWQPDTPVAVVSNVSMPDQKVNIETLGEITGRYQAITPSVIIVGKIIDKEMVFQYLNQKPKVLVTTGTDPA